MLLPKRHNPLCIFLLPQKFNGQYDQAKDKNEKAHPVDTMHITDPFALWP